MTHNPHRWDAIAKYHAEQAAERVFSGRRENAKAVRLTFNQLSAIIEDAAEKAAFEAERYAAADPFGWYEKQL